MIDVAHVYASLYRTYFDLEEFKRPKPLYVGVPAFAFLGGVMAYAVNANLFWRCLAYLAVVHFVRQQYGFLAFYKYRNRENAPWERLLDRWLLYLSTLYPLAYWHTHLPRKFVWFVEGDFFTIPLQQLSQWAGFLYVSLMIVYLLKESYLTLLGRPLNIGKNLVLLTTGLTWYTGIVTYNSDYSFTVTNVVTHGVPYVALIWIYCHRKWALARKPGWLGRLSRPSWLWAFTSLLAGIAFLEEGFWDVLVWGERAAVFGLRYSSPLIENPALLSMLVPLLALPQSTHYVLDAFIWKMNSKNPDLNVHLLG
jgi:hypothetical protein